MRHANTIMNRVARLAAMFVLLASLSLLAGCYAPVKPDPAFAPTTPPVAAQLPQSNGAIYQASTSMPLFEDLRARRVGDLLTIILSENNTANKSANTATSKENDISIANPTLFGDQLPTNKVKITLEQSVDSTQEFAGDGSSEQSNTLSGTIAVTVARVLGNGNLMVQGEKLMTLNQGDEYIRISGIVRPQDITPNNTVLSTLVANARIQYGGKGAIHDANANGWLGRFFQSKYWPF
jgi:flagellar L-ring protein precursor FlgH